ncbi:MAG: hypothetical protein H7338_21445 [Candidatus Sericytochromatia bacterium]|nr:hypothetical protein [Candidatus Sericytochromatia bacterium]
MRHTCLSLILSGSLVACQVPGPANVFDVRQSLPAAGAPAAAARHVGPDGGQDLGVRGGATLHLNFRMSERLHTLGAPPALAYVVFQLRDSGTNAVVATNTVGGYSTSFSNVGAGTYYARFDVIDALSSSIVVGGPQNSTNSVTVTGLSATYTTGFSLVSPTMQLQNGTGGAVAATFTTPYGSGFSELINPATNVVIATNLGSASHHLAQVVDGTYGFWGFGVNGGFATPARQSSNVTVSGNGATVSGAWNVTTPTETIVAGGGGSAANNIPAMTASLGVMGGHDINAAGDIVFTTPLVHQVRFIPAVGGFRYGQAMTAGNIYTIAGTTFGFLGDGGLGTAARLFSPIDCAFDASGNIYVADMNNQRVRLINSAGFISTFAGGGGSVADGISPTAASLTSIRGVSVSGGSLYIADTQANKVRVVTGGIITTYLGTGTASSTGDGGSPLAANVNFPADVAFGPFGHVYVAEEGGNRIRVIAGTTNPYYGQAMTAGNVYSLSSGSGPRHLAIDSVGHVYEVGGPTAVYMVDLANNLRQVGGTGALFSAGGTSGSISLLSNGALQYSTFSNTLVRIL